MRFFCVVRECEEFHKIFGKLADKNAGLQLEAK